MSFAFQAASFNEIRERRHAAHAVVIAQAFARDEKERGGVAL
jgi:hypothetical protein